jgi:hypothetical protein
MKQISQEHTTQAAKEVPAAWVDYFHVVKATSTVRITGLEVMGQDLPPIARGAFACSREDAQALGELLLSLSK